MNIIPYRWIFLLPPWHGTNPVVNTQLQNTPGISQTSTQGLLQMLQIPSYVIKTG